MTDHIFTYVIFNENFLSVMKTSEPVQMVLDSYIGLHVHICLYVRAHGGCVSEERGPVIHGHSLGAIFRFERGALQL